MVRCSPSGGKMRLALTASALFAAVSLAMGGAQELEVATFVSMLEGPAVDRDGNVYFTDILTQRIMRFTSSGALSVYRERSNAANGLLIDPQGRLVACEGAPSATAQRNGITAVSYTHLTLP